MARWATLAEIAGNSFTGCRVLLLDPHAFNSIYVGSIDWGNDSTPSSQVVNRGVKGIQFGASMVSAEESVILATLADIQSAQASNISFDVHITEGLYDVNVNAIPDYSVPAWFTYEKHSEGWYENCVWRFVAQSAN